VNQLFVPLKSFDCLASGVGQLALHPVVGNVGDATRTNAFRESPGASETADDDDRSWSTFPTTAAVHPVRSVPAVPGVVSNVKPAGGEMFTEPRDALLEPSFARVIVKVWWLTVSSLTATCIV
jgi:hypothetical protein